MYKYLIEFIIVELIVTLIFDMLI